MTSHARIDYGYGFAEMWGEFTEANAEQFFMRHANQCFGIRKSISMFALESFSAKSNIPDPWAKLKGAVTVLQHSGDTIVWNAKGKKIKSEFE